MKQFVVIIEGQAGTEEIDVLALDFNDALAKANAILDEGYDPGCRVIRIEEV